MLPLLKRMAYQLPRRRLQSLKRRYFAMQIRGRRFTSEEPEFRLLDELVSEGDWALDVGANVGTYSHRLSQLVGATGRVFALEPIPETFELLVANAQLFPHQNVTLLNLAVSDEARLVQMAAPTSEAGEVRHHLARIVAGQEGTGVFAAPIDSLGIPGRIKLAKIDVEGHEMAALKGMRNLLRRDRPTLIIEASSRQLIDYLQEFGYECEQIPGSWNYVFRFKEEFACCS